ncbi:hypothetical protein ACN47E_002780 [Coniothyrium glycines]
MVYKQSTEKLHTACDECRTRKLKCSGDAPKCVRCKREKMDCIYSLQKQMGRPRKRRREGEETDGPSELSAETQIEHINKFNEPLIAPELHEFGLVLPGDLQDYDYSSNFTDNGVVTTDPNLAHIFPSDDTPIMDYGLDSHIDPSLWNLEPLPTPIHHDNQSPLDPSNPGPCTCLSQMYLTLTDLQSIQSFAFPQIILPLRKAMSTLSDLIHCPQCPKDPFNAIQNTQSIVSLFKAIVERFSKALLAVDLEATHLDATGSKKPFRIGDNNPALSHLHTGTLDCPMGFNIELEGKDWSKIAKTALKTEVHGGGSNPRPLLDLLTQAEARQQRWHSDKQFWSDERKRLYPGLHECREEDKCQALGGDHIRQGVLHLKWE